MRRFSLTMLPQESNECYIFCVCACSLSYPVRKAHASYYVVVCGLSDSTVFLHMIS